MISDSDMNRVGMDSDTQTFPCQKSRGLPAQVSH